MLADGDATAQIMVAVHQAVEQMVGILAALDHDQFNGMQSVEFAFNRLTAMGHLSNLPDMIGSDPCRKRQHDQLSVFKLSKHRTAGHILEHALVGAPAPQLAKLNGQPAAQPIRMLCHQRSDQLDIRFR